MPKVQLSNRELAAFCEQSSMLLRAGIPIQDGIQMMLSDVKTDKDRQVLQSILDKYDTGCQLSDALEESLVFPKYMVDMIRIGEISGKLDNVMHALSDYYLREQQVSDNIKNAIRYPAIMIVMMLVVVLILIIKVMPVFAQVYAQFGSELSGVSAAIMLFGNALSRYSLLIVAIIAMATVFYIYCKFTENGKVIGKYILQNSFATKKIYLKIAASRFASGLSLMISSGIDTDKSLEMVKELVDTKIYKDKISVSQTLIAEGESLENALVKSELFSGLSARMLIIGFRTGNADKAMGNIAHSLSEEVDYAVTHQISLIEPSLVAVFSVVVGMILLSVILPLIGIMSSIG